MRKNRVKVAQGSSRAPGVHEDLMIIYPQPGTSQFRADYFDNEGNVIHYGISFGEHTVVFESDEPGRPMRFKLTYELNANSTLNINFAMAPLGKAFQTCLSGVAKRK